MCEAGSRHFLPGAETDPIWPEPESAPGSQTSGAEAAENSAGPATLLNSMLKLRINQTLLL